MLLHRVKATREESSVTAVITYTDFIINTITVKSSSTLADDHAAIRLK